MRFRSVNSLFLALLLAALLVAAEVPKPEEPFSSSSSAPHRQPQPHRKVAVIGSGPSGSSAAYWLHQARLKLARQSGIYQLSNDIDDLAFSIDLYERDPDSRIGGRVRSIYPYNDDSYDAIELGASIYASEVNLNMARFVRDFKLSPSVHFDEDGSTTAIWDGATFVVDNLDTSTWWSSAKIFWRYGYAPLTARGVVNELKDGFRRLYGSLWLHEREQQQGRKTKSGFPWRSVEDIANKIGVQDSSSQTALSYFISKGVSSLFISEVIEAASRVNYAQNTDEIHGLGAGVCLAASAGPKGVKGGNAQVFEELVRRSRATTHFGKRGEVTGLVRFATMSEAVEAGRVSTEEASTMSWGSGPKWWVGTAAGTGGLYDAVLVATPWHNAGITLLGTETVIPIAEYVRLHVTLLVTNASQPNAEYFSRPAGAAIPTSILTTYETVRKQDQDKQKLKGRQAIGGSLAWTASFLPSWAFGLLGIALGGWHNVQSSLDAEAEAKKAVLEFQSLNYLTKLPKRPDSPPDAAADHVVKIFSLGPLSDGQLSSLFSSESISWTHRQTWDAYPKLRPRQTFAPIEAEHNLYYINGFESLISTMETSTVSSRNAVALLLEKWYGLDFVVGKDCQFQKSKGTSSYGTKADEGDGEDWDGWGCYSA